MIDFLVTHGLWICLLLLAIIFLIVIFLPAPADAGIFSERVWTVEEVIRFVQLRTGTLSGFLVGRSIKGRGLKNERYC